MLGLDFHLISIFCLHRTLYKIQRWKKVLGEKKSRPQKERKGIILSRKENIPLWKLLLLAELHACVQISTKEVAVKPKFAIHDGHYCVVLLNAPLSDRGKKKSVCNGLLFTGNIHPSSMTLGGPVVLLVCGFKRHYLHNQSEYRKSPTHFCSFMLCELGCGAILHVLHTYTYIYFIYARNSQCSCRANIFEATS